MGRRVLSALIILAASDFWVMRAVSEESLVTISSPSDGEKLAAGQAYKVNYEVKDSAAAHHVHLFVDGVEIATGHKLKGSLPLGPLKVGERKVCLAPVNKNHTPVGAQTCVTVKVQ